MLPLWEGFDEPFHYGYIEHLRTTRRFPEVNRTTLSGEIRTSLRLTPVSWILHNALPGSIAFDDWFRLGPEERRQRRAAVKKLPLELQRESSDLLNYEAQQAPLAYLLLTPLDAVVSGMKLPARVLVLRLCPAMVSAVLLVFGARLLVQALDLRGGFRLAMLACVLESQVLWASIAHIGNDWLAVSLSVLFLGTLTIAARGTCAKYVMASSAVLAAGLVTKAYFLAFVPVFLGLIMREMLARRLPMRTAIAAASVILIAAPWYVRNVVLYGSFGGTQESIAGVGLLEAGKAFFHINWLGGTVDLFRSALWTGNWSFVAFSRLTLNMEMTVAAAGFVLFLIRARQIGTGERWLLLACGFFFIGLMYQSCITWVASHGESRHVEPWYLQCILPALWALVFLGFQRSGTVGKLLAGALVALSGWIAAVTYLMKLIPYYGGFRGRSTIAGVLNWWRNVPLEALSVTMLGPVGTVFAALAGLLVVLGFLTVLVLRALSEPVGYNLRN